MIKTSREYKDRIVENREFDLKATLTFKDGTKLELTCGDFIKDTFAIDDGVSGNGSFDIGSAIINQHKFVLNNYEDKFSGYDFTGATIIPSVGLQLSASVEWLKKGIYTVDEAKMSGATISITALDNMAKFDKTCNRAPAKGETLRELVMYACSACGVILGTSDFTNANYKLVANVDDALTWRQVISYAAQIAGCYAKINVNGYLTFGWYDFSVFDSEGELDGGGLDKYDQATQVDGGDFTDYDQEITVDGGGFSELDAYHHIYTLASQEICTDDVVITGIKVTEDTDDATTFLYGVEGYVLGISDNPFIGKGQGETVATYLGEKIVGMRFRPLKVSALSDPSIEAGDLAVISDRKGNAYRTVLTNLSYMIGNYETYTCDAETPSRLSADRNAALTKTIVKKMVEAEATEREKMFEDLNTRLENSGGLFTTFETLSDGSVKYYLHDKQLLADSVYVWKITSEVIAASTNGGKTYTTALSVDGKFLIDQISTIGLNAEIIKAGTIEGIDIIAKHTDGTYTLLNSAGLTHYDGGVGTSYHYLTYAGEVEFTSMSSTGKTLTVQLPDAFKGKNVSISLSVKSITPPNPSALTDCLSILETSYAVTKATAKVDIYARCNFITITLNTSVSPWVIQSMTRTYPKSLVVSYTATA